MKVAKSESEERTDMVALLKQPRGFDQTFKLRPDERRTCARKEIQVRVEGKRIDHTLSARQQPHISLSLRDLSLGGLSGLSDLPLQAGERIAVFFPPHGSNRGWDAYGRVIRCDPCHQGYRIAVEFDPIAAAA